MVVPWQFTDLGESQVAGARFTTALANHEQTAIQRMERSYLAAAKRLKPLWEEAEARLREAKLAGYSQEYLSGFIWNEQRLASIFSGIVTEMRKLSQETGTALDPALVKAGATAKKALLAEARTLPKVAQAGFVNPPLKELQVLTGRLDDAAPLGQLLQDVAGDSAQAMKRELVAGVANGENPLQVARRMAEVMGSSFGRASLIARTEMLNVYRETVQDTIRANKHIYKAWKWVAALSDRTCPICWALHGTIHPLEERFSSHPGCRCNAVPVPKPWEEISPLLAGTKTLPERPTGVEVFRTLPAARQKTILGPLGYQAYKKGLISLEDLPAPKWSPKWGPGRRQRSLTELLGAKQVEKLKRDSQKRKPAPGKKAIPKPKPKKAAIQPPVPQEEAWVTETKALIAQGPKDEAEVRAIGSKIRAEIEKDAGPAALRRQALQQQMNDLAAEEMDITSLLAEPSSFMRDDYYQLRDRQYQIQRQKRDVESQLRQHGNKYPRDKVTAHLKKVRAGFGEGNVEGVNWTGSRSTDADLIPIMKDAASRLPKEWVADWQGIECRLKKVGRGEFRGWYDQDNMATGRRAEIDISGSSLSTAIHELTHWAEHKRPGLVAAEESFYERRTKGEKLRSLKRIYPGSGYSAKEKARVDQFVSAYMGKDYRPWPYWEIATMGVESLMTDPDKVRYDLSGDDDYVDFILGVLAAL